MEFCTNYPLVAWTHVDRHTALFTRLRCGQWSCEFCAKKNASIWRAFLLSKLSLLSDTWYLMTLTAHSRMRTQGQSLKNLRDNIERIMKRIRRVFGEVEYVRVFEKHPTSDAVHAHFIISGITDYVVAGASAKHQPMYIGVFSRCSHRCIWSVRTWLKKTAQECQIGYIADIRRIHGDTSFATWYVTKYLTKAQQDLKIKGLRHVQTSRGIGSPKHEGEYKWRVGSFVTTKDFENGQTVIDLQTGEAIDGDYWSDFDVYPPEMK